MKPEDFTELARLTEENDALLGRLAERGVTANGLTLALDRLEAKLDVLLGDNLPRAMLAYQRRLANQWDDVENQLGSAIARRTLLGPDGGPLG